MRNNLLKRFKKNENKIAKLVERITMLAFERQTLIDENRRIKAMKEVFDKWLS